MEKNEQVSGSQTGSEEDLLDFDLDDLTSDDLVVADDEGETDIIELVDLVEKGDGSSQKSAETSAESAELDDLDVFAEEMKAEKTEPAPDIDLDVSDITQEMGADKPQEPNGVQGPLGEISADDSLEDLSLEGTDDIETVSAEESLEEKGSGTMEFVADSDLEKLFEEELRAEGAVKTESAETKEAEPEAAAQAIVDEDIVTLVDEKPAELEELPQEDALKVEASSQGIAEEIELGEQPEEVAPEPSPLMPVEPPADEEPLTLEEAPPVVEEIQSAPETLAGLSEEKIEEILTRVVGDVVERVTRETVASVAERVTRETVTTVAERVIGEAIEALKKSLEN